MPEADVTFLARDRINSKLYGTWSDMCKTGQRASMLDKLVTEARKQHERKVCSVLVYCKNG